MTPVPAIEASGLSKTYPAPWALTRIGRSRPGARRALTSVSFQVSAGEVIALIGPNGAGKSTLLRILTGLLLPTEGQARVAGLDVVKDRPGFRRDVGAVLSDDRGLSPRLTVRQNLEFYAALFDVPRALARERLERLAEWVDAATLLERPVRTLSSGERARALIIRALVHEPKVVLLDEVTRSLDPGSGTRLRSKLLGRLREQGAAVLLASHDLHEVEAVADRVLLLSGGAVRAFGRFAEVRAPAQAAYDGPERVP